MAPLPDEPAEYCITTALHVTGSEATLGCVPVRG